MPVETLINGDEDMQWLRDVHIPNLAKKYKSAVIVGNEDAPERIEVFEDEDPDYDDDRLVYRPDEDGVFHRSRE